MKTTRFKQLLKKRYESDLSQEEQAEFDVLLDQYSRNEIAALIDETIIVDMQMSFEKEKVLEQLHAKVGGTVRKKSKRMRWLGYVAAASVIGLLFWWKLNVEKGPHGEMQASVDSKDTTELLLPDDVAMIRLEDGRSFVMADTVDEINTAAVHVRRIGQGIYHFDVKPDSEHKEEFHTFSTPKGVSSRVILSDGTEVHLNSASQMEVSSRYSKGARRIRLDGEAYFDVAKAKGSLFSIEAKGMQVSVLGTKFNVRALPNENVIKATLEDGRVEIKNNHSQVVLKPGQQATARVDQEKINIATVDVEEVLAWKDGYFTCTDMPLENFLEELARWYNIEEIVWERKTKERVTLSLARNRSLNELLTRIEAIADVRLEIKERRLVVR